MPTLNPQKVDIFNDMSDFPNWPWWINLGGAVISMPGRDHNATCVTCNWNYPASSNCGYMCVTDAGDPIPASSGCLMGFACKIDQALSQIPVGAIFSAGVLDTATFIAAVHSGARPPNYGLPYFQLAVNTDLTLSLVSVGASGSPPYYLGGASVIGPPSQHTICIGSWFWVEISLGVKIISDITGTKDIVTVNLNFSLQGKPNDSVAYGSIPYTVPFGTWPGEYFDTAVFTGNAGNVSIADFYVSHAIPLNILGVPTTYYGDMKACPTPCPP